MTVQELIIRLKKVKNKDKQLMIQNGAFYTSITGIEEDILFKTEPFSCRECVIVNFLPIEDTHTIDTMEFCKNVLYKYFHTKEE